ncbi:hypothetical protein VNO80_12767 [Phaseolus coccineus]|uniref:Uncharacterized protein n=1 Tax=Phaseolus coccineus TaxID=3886 RepID=A0AAN9N0U5_PHACN
MISFDSNESSIFFPVKYWTRSIFHAYGTSFQDLIINFFMKLPLFTFLAIDIDMIKSTHAEYLKIQKQTEFYGLPTPESGYPCQRVSWSKESEQRLNVSADYWSQEQKGAVLLISSELIYLSTQFGVVTVDHVGNGKQF